MHENLPKDLPAADAPLDEYALNADVLVYAINHLVTLYMEGCGKGIIGHDVEPPVGLHDKLIGSLELTLINATDAYTRNRTDTARILGIGRSTIYRKVQGAASFNRQPSFVE